MFRVLYSSLILTCFIISFNKISGFLFINLLFSFFFNNFLYYSTGRPAHWFMG